MLKQVFIIFIVLFKLGGTVCSQNQLSVYVQGLDSVPILDANILLLPMGKSLVVDSVGKYHFKNLLPGKYALQYINHEDYSITEFEMFAQDTSIWLLVTSTISLNEVLVRANQMNTQNYPNVTSLQTPEIQERSFEKDLPYVLQHAPGVMSQSDAGNGVGYTGIRFRALDPSHIQLTLNGIPFTDAESSLTYFVDIPNIVFIADNIQLYRGNVPNRPGTPSFGGAIDVQTNKVYSKAGGNLDLQFGDFNTWKYSVIGHSGLLLKQLYVDVGVSKQHSDGYIDRSESNLNSVSFSMGLLGKKSSFRLNYIHGNELTQQAWFGLPIQFADKPERRTFNLAGTSKPGTPFDQEIDRYSQDHFQFFFINEFNPQFTWSNTLNLTFGDGYYQNYIASANLVNYGIESPDAVSDLTRRKWLDNQFIFFCSNLEYRYQPGFVIQTGIGGSIYKGSHYGKVNQVYNDDFKYLKDPYYENDGEKKDGSVQMKVNCTKFEDWKFGLDVQYRTVQYVVNGLLEYASHVDAEVKYGFFIPKLFVDYEGMKNHIFYASGGYMQREAFREDLISQSPDLRSELLLDAELGLKGSWKTFHYAINAYYMHYPRLRGLSGALSDVGEPLFIVLENVSNRGVEIGIQWKPFKNHNLFHQSAFTDSNIPQWKESIQIYEADWASVTTEHVQHFNKPLAYQPSWVSFTEWKMALPWHFTLLDEMKLFVQHQLVADFYLDNTGNPSSLLNGYQVWHLGFSTRARIFGKMDFEGWVSIQNLFNQEYASHGWISRIGYKGTLNLSDDPYTGKEEAPFYHYKALYPQALRHITAGVRMYFR